MLALEATFLVIVLSANGTGIKLLSHNYRLFQFYTVQVQSWYILMLLSLPQQRMQLDHHSL